MARVFSQGGSRERPQAALQFMRAYIRAVREYNDALENGRIAGPNADEVISILTSTSSSRIPTSRQITPAAIDPDGRLGLAVMRTDLAYFKEQRLIQDPGITVEKIIKDLEEQAAEELGPYRPRRK